MAFPHMSVEQNIAFGLKQDKMPKGEIDVSDRFAMMAYVKRAVGIDFTDLKFYVNNQLISELQVRKNLQLLNVQCLVQLQLNQQNQLMLLTQQLQINQKRNQN